MGTVVSAITGVFTEIGNWFLTFIPSMIALFYIDGALTFLGTLAICGLAVSLFFLIVGLISNFIKFRA